MTKWIRHSETKRPEDYKTKTKRPKWLRMTKYEKFSHNGKWLIMTCNDFEYGNFEYGNLKWQKTTKKA